MIDATIHVRRGTTHDPLLQRQQSRATGHRQASGEHQLRSEVRRVCEERRLQSVAEVERQHRGDEGDDRQHGMRHIEVGFRGELAIDRPAEPPVQFGREEDLHGSLT